VNYLAVHDGDRQLAGLARSLTPASARLSALLEYPELLTQLRGAEAKLPGQSVYLTGYTPFDQTVRFEFA
jgi:hypothetical protein